MLTFSGEHRFILDCIRWETYQAIASDLEGRRIRLSYDQGNLELMMTGALHEYYRSFLASIVGQIVLTLNIPIRSGGR